MLQKKHRKKCEACGEEFFTAYKKTKTCGKKACASKIRKKNTPKTQKDCRHCGKTFSARPGQIYCQASCYHAEATRMKEERRAFLSEKLKKGKEAERRKREEERTAVWVENQKRKTLSEKEELVRDIRTMEAPPIRYFYRLANLVCSPKAFRDLVGEHIEKMKIAQV